MELAQFFSFHKKQKCDFSTNKKIVAEITGSYLSARQYQGKIGVRMSIGSTTAKINEYGVERMWNS